MNGRAADFAAWPRPSQRHLRLLADGRPYRPRNTPGRIGSPTAKLVIGGWLGGTRTAPGALQIGPVDSGRIEVDGSTGVVRVL